MHKPNYLELMWDMMKGLGFYQQYENYQEWKEDIGLSSTPSKPKKDFRATLTPEEQGQYDYMFGKESG